MAMVLSSFQICCRSPNLTPKANSSPISTCDRLNDNNDNCYDERGQTQTCLFKDISLDLVMEVVPTTKYCQVCMLRTLYLCLVIDANPKDVGCHVNDIVILST